MMRHPAFKTVPRQIVYLTLCILNGMALALCLVELLPVPKGVLLLDGLMQGILTGLLVYVLWFIVRFSDMGGSADSSVQRVINHAALLIMMTLLWVGGGFLLEQLLFPKHTDALTLSIPLKSVFGFLVFIYVIRLYKDWKMEEEFLEDEVTEITESPALLQETPTTKPFKALETISVKNGQKIHLIQVSSIEFLQAEGDYVLIHTPEGKFLKEQTMKYFEENLPVEHFIRIHRSYIVHAECISKIELYEKQNYRITLKNGQQLKASATGYKQLKAVLKL